MYTFLHLTFSLSSFTSLFSMFLDHFLFHIFIVPIKENNLFTYNKMTVIKLIFYKLYQVSHFIKCTHLYSNASVRRGGLYEPWEVFVALVSLLLPALSPNPALPLLCPLPLPLPLPLTGEQHFLWKQFLLSVMYNQNLELAYQFILSSRHSPGIKLG